MWNLAPNQLLCPARRFEKNAVELLRMASRRRRTRRASKSCCLAILRLKRNAKSEVWAPPAPDGPHVYSQTRGRATSAQSCTISERSM